MVRVFPNTNRSLAGFYAEQAAVWAKPSCGPASSAKLASQAPAPPSSAGRGGLMRRPSSDRRLVHPFAPSPISSWAESGGGLKSRLFRPTAHYLSLFIFSILHFSPQTFCYLYSNKRVSL